MKTLKNKNNLSLISLSSIVIFFLVFLCTAGYSQIQTGEAVIKLSSGKKKSIIFPHKTHQTILADCSICHNSFPMEKSAIRKLIEKGSLKKKAVMKQCQSCHKAMLKEKKKTGPTSCKNCHTSTM